ncbi:RidA family protein [Gemmatimonas groenlandica]|uniref:RidA family protein n=1 Tax=Gemmatimonas groenlandica TaxID=2732249 RepID=A0A6M4IS67_9BACT|nr:RidA family protein [Gemmatimonas groenlandica]QJR36367.1 RidA family protein [Gemmatimonas groenlandica]
MHRTLQPDGWSRPRGYANGISARGRQIHVAGQIGWNAQQQMVSDDFVAQARQALRNIVEVLACDGATPEHLVRLTWYVTDRERYIASGAALGEAYREILGRVYPAMSAVQVCALMEPDALVEIEATAIVPDEPL